MRTKNPLANISRGTMNSFKKKPSKYLQDIYSIMEFQDIGDPNVIEELHDTYPDLEKRMKALINKKVVRNMEDAAYFLGVVSLYNPHSTEAFSMLEEHGRRAVLLNTEAKAKGAHVPWEGIYREQLKNWKKKRGEDAPS
ncbi:hypothetical protein D6783_04455, partial [Candidatus Woesearchaeota archaeon]